MGKEKSKEKRTKRWASPCHGGGRRWSVRGDGRWVVRTGLPGGSALRKLRKFIPGRAWLSEDLDYIGKGEKTAGRPRKTG